MTNLISASDYCESIFDGTHSTPKPTSDGRVLITSKHIAGGTLDSSSAYQISDSDYVAIQKRSAVSQWDILFSMIGSVGEIYLEKNSDIPYAIKNIGVFSCKNEARAKWLYYYLQSPSAKSHINRYLNGAVQKFLPLGALRSFPVIPFDEGKAELVRVLETLDAKIDCNNRINRELESFSKMLYDHWFVQFDFPDNNGNPYKSSGGAMIYSDALKRKIPEGWKSIELNEIISRSGTGLNPRNNFKLGSGNNYYVTIKNVTNGKIILDDKCDRIDDEALKIINNRSQLQGGDILFTSIEPVGVTYLIHEKPNNWDINESVFTIRPNLDRTTSEHLFLLLSSSEMKLFTKNSSSGSIHKGIRHGVLKTFLIAYSGVDLINKFSIFTKPLLKKMDILEKETQSLIRLRDWLLPMLMNGQVTLRTTMKITDL